MSGNSLCFVERLVKDGLALRRPCDPDDVCEVPAVGLEEKVGNHENDRGDVLLL